MPVVDIHCHVYPAKIAEKATASVGDFYHVEMIPALDIEVADGEPVPPRGSVDHMLALTEGTPISHHLIHSVAIKPATVESINDFIAEECRKHDNLVGFMAMHQDYENPEAEIDRAMAMGLRGIKLHPDTQAVDLDDPRLMKIYEIAERKGLRLIIHTGDYRTDYSHPRRLVNVLHEFPELVVDGAHFGGWSVFDMALEYLEDERNFVDLSSAMSFLGPRRTRELIEIYGADRVMYGSDFPMWDPREELKTVRSLGLSQLDYEKVTWHTAERFLGMEFQ